MVSAFKGQCDRKSLTTTEVAVEKIPPEIIVRCHTLVSLICFYIFQFISLLCA